MVVRCLVYTCCKLHGYMVGLRLLRSALFSLFSYVPQITFDTNSVAHCLFSIGYAFMRMHKQASFESSEFIPI